jgi:tubulin-specific chaperone E
MYRYSCTYHQLGRSKQHKAGSFVRPSRPADQPLSFIEALHKKYAPESEPGRVWEGRHHARGDSDDQIEISGKIVEEVGFEKIRELLADLHELRIVLLDGLCIGGLLATQSSSTEEQEREISKIQETCPNIRELDLSLNLFEDWQDIAMICSALKNLQSLKLTCVFKISLGTVYERF